MHEHLSCNLEVQLVELEANAVQALHSRSLYKKGTLSPYQLQQCLWVWQAHQQQVGEYQLPDLQASTRQWATFVEDCNPDSWLTPPPDFPNDSSAVCHCCLGQALWNSPWNKAALFRRCKQISQSSKEKQACVAPWMPSNVQARHSGEPALCLSRKPGDLSHSGAPHRAFTCSSTLF